MALWIGGVIEQPDGLFYASPSSLKRLGADVYMEHELLGIDVEKKEVHIKDLQNNITFTDSYNKLILALGSWPVLPPIPGHDLGNIHYVKIFQNAQTVMRTLKDENVQNVAIVGAGYIGVELAEAFVQNGKHVTLINDYDVLNRYYDPHFQDLMHDNLIQNGVEVRTGELVTEFQGENGQVQRVVTTQNTYDVDMVLMSIGFKPNTDLLVNTGIEMTPNGAIITDKHQETNIEGIFAIGDCSTVYHNALDTTAHIALATNAVRTGIVAGHSACGTDIAMQGVQGSNAIHIFGLTMCSTGLTEQEAKNAGYDVGSVQVNEWIKPAFMPENDQVTLKVVWDKDTRCILGAQMASNADVTLALHMFSLAIQERYSIDKLALTDLFFLPHFNQPHNFITKAGLLALGK